RRVSGALEDQGYVVPTEAEGLVDGGHVTGGHLLGGAAHHVHSRFRVQFLDVDRGRDTSLVQGEHGGDRFDRSGAAQQVAGHRFGGGHAHAVGGRVPQGCAERAGLAHVTGRGGGRVRVDVRDVGRLQV